MLWIVVALATANVPAASGLTPLQSFYPPQLNDTSYISNATIGTYGGVYQSPTRGPNTTAPYGSYDYCAMPHPRVQEYRMPEPIQNGSIKANLVYLEYLQRHQRRTPYNILPGGEVVDDHSYQASPTGLKSLMIIEPRSLTFNRMRPTIVMISILFSTQVLRMVPRLCPFTRGHIPTRLIRLF